EWPNNRIPVCPLSPISLLFRVAPADGAAANKAQANLRGGNTPRKDASMTRIGLATGLAIAALLPLGAMAADHIVVQRDAIQWKPAPPFLMKGAQIAVLFGDPAKPGPFAIRMKF